MDILLPLPPVGMMRGGRHTFGTASHRQGGGGPLSGQNGRLVRAIAAFACPCSISRRTPRRAIWNHRASASWIVPAAVWLPLVRPRDAPRTPWLRSAHGCWAHRCALPRPTYLCLVSGDIMALPRENGPITRVEAFFTWSCCCNPCPLGTADPQRNARHWRGPELLGATQPQGCVPEVGSESSARRESRETAARRFGGVHGLPAGGCPPHRRPPT